MGGVVCQPKSLLARRVLLLLILRAIRDMDQGKVWWLAGVVLCRCSSMSLQAAMPPAQNLAVVVNLRASTRFLAPRLAKLLLRLYVAAALPVTLWITIFVSRLPVPLASL